jgi:hypothetical protein
MGKTRFRVFRWTYSWNYLREVPGIRKYHGLEKDHLFLYLVVREGSAELLPVIVGGQILTSIADSKWKSSILAGERGATRDKFPLDCSPA